MSRSCEQPSFYIPNLPLGIKELQDDYPNMNITFMGNTIPRTPQQIDEWLIKREQYPIEGYIAGILVNPSGEIYLSNRVETEPNGWGATFSGKWELGTSAIDELLREKKEEIAGATIQKIEPLVIVIRKFEAQGYKEEYSWMPFFMLHIEQDDCPKLTEQARKEGLRGPRLFSPQNLPQDMISLDREIIEYFIAK